MFMIILKKHWDKIAFAVALILFAACLVNSVGTIIAGSKLADGLGVIGGQFAGTIEGVRKADDAYLAGKEEGFSAKDTVVEIKGRFQDIEKLQVLAVNLEEYDVHTYPKDKTIDPEYAAIFTRQAEAVFTVDLSGMTVEKSGENTLIITVPLPTHNLYYTSETTLIDEFLRYPWSGNAQDGSKGLKNSNIEIEKKLNEKLSNDGELMQQAKESAKEQIEEIANAVSINCEEIIIEFREEHVNE